MSSSTYCAATATGTSEPRGLVLFKESTSGANFLMVLQGCTNSQATFSGKVYPGTYQVTVSGETSDLPRLGYVAKSALVVNAAVPDLRLDVVTYPVSGSVTLNGANPVSSSASCSTGDVRGSVTFTDSASGVAALFMDLQGCTNSLATFSGKVYPGTYQVTVVGGSSDLPGEGYVAKSSLVVNAAVSDLKLDVVMYPVSGSVTMNGANLVSSSTYCTVTATGTSDPRGLVMFQESTSGARFLMELQGCTNSLATFSGKVYPGTYQVTIVGGSSDLPGEGYVAVYQLKVP